MIYIKLFIGLLIMLGSVNLGTYVYIYWLGNYSKKVKKIYLISGNIIAFAIWLYIVLFYASF